MRRTTRSNRLLHRAQSVIPGGVNSADRAFRDVDRSPLFIRKASAAFLWDVDGNKFIDFSGARGQMLLGHANPGILKAIRTASKQGTNYAAPCELELRLAELISRVVPSVEMVRLVSSGTEAAMSAVRLARAFTSRPKIITFEGCYHGHADTVASRQPLLAAPQPHRKGTGIPDSFRVDHLVASFNDLGSVETLFREHPNAIAAVVIEPVAAHLGCIPPAPGFLEGVRALCAGNGALLIFDEVTTGFRVSLGGAQELYDVKPDLTVLGKILGGGLPIGAYGGRRDIMHAVAPTGPMEQTGSFSGNPLAMAAGLETLRIIMTHKLLYRRLEESSARLEAMLRGECDRRGIRAHMNRVGSMWSLAFSSHPVTDYAAATNINTHRYAQFFNAMLEQGIYLPASPWETAFLSTAHTPRLLDRTRNAFRAALQRF